MERDETKKESKTKKDQSKEKGSYLFFFQFFYQNCNRVRVP
jgi:hypothetical protein